MISIQRMLVFLCCALPAPVFSSQSSHIDAATGAQSWQVDTHGVYFSLLQILPEQAQAFYVNRGFSLQQIEPYTSSCIYMTVLRNDSAEDAIHYVRDNWSVTVDGKEGGLLSVAQWLQRLEQVGVKKSALIAFRWAQFPPQQTYQPGGDWNQGMLAIDLAPGQTFDITARWDMGGRKFSSTLKGVKCAQ